MRSDVAIIAWLAAAGGLGVGVAAAGPIVPQVPGPLRADPGATDPVSEPVRQYQTSDFLGFLGGDASLGLVAFNSTTGVIGSYVTGVASAMQDDVVSLGTAPTGSEIMASWTESPSGIDGQPNLLEVRYYTADGSLLLPNGTQLAGTEVTNLGWNFGVQNPLEFAPFVTDTELIQATFQGINRGSDLGTPSDDRLLLSIPVTGLFDGDNSSWSLGTGVVDGGTFDLVAAGGLAMDEIRIRYQFNVTPAPGSAATIMCALGLGLCRRRR